ncbi:MAG: potassium transporter TrkG [Clostridia bacterium]|nr:potassium transporter TrkG [Clostridia bacterium]
MRGILSKLNAAQIIIYGFLFVIFIGTLLLMLPFSSAKGEVTGFIDALFTSTSCVCITGLTVVTTAEHWSLFGQWVILGLIQIGGLGFMCIVTMIFIAIGRKITIRERNVIQEAHNLNIQSGVVSFAMYIFKVTMAVELIGSAILALKFIPEFGLLGGIYRGIFHGISAFCNAGFDIIGSESISQYSGDLIINAVIMVLIVIGGLGFPVVQDIIVMFKNIKNKKFSLKFSLGRLKLQSKIAVTATAVLIITGALFVFLFEFNNTRTMAHMGIGDKILASFFQSVTWRTAGYFTIDQGGLEYSTKILGIVLMFIGGSPAGTAGGAKTVTMSVLLIAIFSLVRGKSEVNAFKRTIGMEIIQKSLSVVMMMLFVTISAVTVLSYTEAGLLMGNGGGFELLDIVYEVSSAIGTVGLTTGITPLLSDGGKLVISLCMYIGRVGPISLAVALSAKKNGSGIIRYPDGNIIVG